MKKCKTEFIILIKLVIEYHRMLAKLLIAYSIFSSVYNFHLVIVLMFFFSKFAIFFFVWCYLNEKNKQKNGKQTRKLTRLTTRH